MKKNHRSIALLLLFIFGVLTLKGFFAKSSGAGSCGEFGHIHFYNIHKIEQSLNSLKKLSDHTHDDEDQNCQEGKALFYYNPVSSQDINFAILQYKIDFKLIFLLENHFKSPLIKLSRKPPKYS